jgi:predicted RNA-binding protein with RPS1 domain
MKDLTPSAWEGFVATHRPGDVVRGKISRFTNFGIFVELGEGLEGLCHISELSDERVERPEDVAQIGQEMDFKILRIEPQDQKIGLSRRAVGKDDEPIVDTRIYSSEAKSGMASLGELAKLKFGSSEEDAPAEEEAAKKKSKKEAKAEKAEAYAAAEANAESETTETVPDAADSPAAAVEAEATVPEPASSEEHATAAQQEVPAEPTEAVPEETEEVSPESGEATGEGTPVEEAPASEAVADAQEAPAENSEGESEGKSA